MATTLHHVCEECSSDFTLKYDEEQVESNPQNCPFCGSYILEDMDSIEDDE